ncbi:MAG: hypothetical protein ABJB05_00510 [Parafilimonas sp.]
MKFDSILRCQKLAIAFFFLIISLKLYAQNIDTDPGAYMTAISNAQTNMNKTYLSYMSAVAHSGRAKKVEKLRQQTLQSIQDCKFKISDLPYFKHDNSLRQSSMNYVDVCYKVFNDDYAHLLNMEDIIEQSFDDMQLYILLQEKTNEKVHDAADTMEQAEKSFATKYNITLIDSKDEVSENMETIAKISHYRDQVYLIFYKCNWQDGQITDAINAKKLTGLEEARNALDNYAKEGLLALDSLNNFQGDRSLAQACKQTLQFYQKLAENDMPKVTDFFLKEDNFDKLKKATDAKQGSLNKQDVDAYNKAVNDFNAATNQYNQLNANINTQRSQAVDNWNNADKQFLDVHTPHVK